jgi:hypothetical protein
MDPMRPAFLVVTALLIPAVAHADLLSMRIEAHGGGAGGVGLGGASKDDAFGVNARGPAYGALVGIELLFIDAWIEHQQTVHDGALATWTQFMTGVDVELDLGTPDKVRGAKETPRPKGYVEIGVGVGFGVGTGAQVALPLDNAQVTDKGFLAEGRIGAGINLGRALSLGVVIPVSAGYFFKSGAGVFANDSSTHYQALEAAALLNLRFHLKLK